MSIRSLPLHMEIGDLGLQLMREKVAYVQTHPVLLDQIKKAQTTDEKLAEIYKVRKGKREDYNLGPHGTLPVNERICYPDKEDLKR